MAITIDQANIGTFTADSESNTTVLTTNQDIAANALVIVGFGAIGTTETVSGISGGSLTWAIDKQGLVGGQAETQVIGSAQNGGSILAAGAQITASWTGVGGAGRSAGGLSLLGAKTSSPVDGTPVGPTGFTTQAWGTDSYVMSAGSILIGVANTGTVGQSHTATTGTEAFEALDTTDGYGIVCVYRIEPSAGSYTVAGSWNGTGNSGNIAVAYLEAEEAEPAPYEFVAAHGTGMGKW